jgi:hypothetical protein
MSSSIANVLSISHLREYLDASPLLEWESFESIIPLLLLVSITGEHFEFSNMYDLLLTKIQIIEINEKDLKDILRLVAANNVNPDGYNYNDINLSFVEKMTGENYGFYRSYL